MKGIENTNPTPSPALGPIDKSAAAEIARLTLQVAELRSVLATLERNKQAACGRCESCNALVKTLSAVRKQNAALAADNSRLNHSLTSNSSTHSATCSANTSTSSAASVSPARPAVLARREAATQTHAVPAAAAQPPLGLAPMPADAPDLVQLISQRMAARDKARSERAAQRLARRLGAQRSLAVVREVTPCNDEASVAKYFVSVSSAVKHCSVSPVASPICAASRSPPVDAVLDLSRDSDTTERAQTPAVTDTEQAARGDGGGGDDDDGDDGDDGDDNGDDDDGDGGQEQDDEHHVRSSQSACAPDPPADVVGAPAAIADEVSMGSPLPRISPYRPTNRQGLPLRPILRLANEHGTRHERRTVQFASSPPPVVFVPRKTPPPTPSSSEGDSP